MQISAQRRTAQQKVNMLELMLGQIANYCPIISCNTIVKNSTSIEFIWSAIRLHFGFQATGAHFVDFNNIKLQPDERPEDLYQRLMVFVEDSLLNSSGHITMSKSQRMRNFLPLWKILLFLHGFALLIQPSQVLSNSVMEQNSAPELLLPLSLKFHKL